MSTIIEVIYSVIGEYGLTVVIFVLMMQIIVLPFELLSRKNKRAKQIAEPKIKLIQKKYGVNAIGGFDTNCDSELDPEIRAMNDVEKEKEMNREIDGIYHETGYKPLTGFVPGFLKVVLILLLYVGVRTACPEGIYQASIIDSKANLYHKIITTTVIMWTFLFDGIIPITKTMRLTPREKLKKSLIGPVVGGFFSIGLTTWVAHRATLAITVGMLTLHISEMILTTIVNANPQRKNNTVAS